MKTKKLTDQSLQTFAKKVKTTTLSISYEAHTGHVGSALSISDIVSVLYFSILNISPKKLTDKNRDRFILSKGHAVASLYAALFHMDILSQGELDSFGGDDDGLSEHPEIQDKGIEMSSGSLGHGLAFGAGIALGLKKQKSSGRVFVLISDADERHSQAHTLLLLSLNSFC